MLQDIITPIFICVVLPVMIVWLIARASMNSDNKRAQVLIEAIRANKELDTTEIARAFQKRKKTFREILMNRLLLGLRFALVGVALAICTVIMTCTGDFYWDDVIVWMFISAVCIAVGASYLIVYYISRKNDNNRRNDQDENTAE